MARYARLLIGTLALLFAGTMSASAAPAAATSAVTIAGFAYNPKTITVNVGDIVQWTNNDAASHTATGSGGTFNTGTIGPDQSATVTFNVAGTFNYICNFHPTTMSGTVVVRGAATPVPTLPPTPVPTPRPTAPPTVAPPAPTVPPTVAPTAAPSTATAPTEAPTATPSPTPTTSSPASPTATAALIAAIASNAPSPATQAAREESGPAIPLLIAGGLVAVALASLAGVLALRRR